MDRGHEVLTVTGTSLIDTQQADDPEDGTWDDVADASTTMADHLSHNLYTAPGPELSKIAGACVGERPLADSPAHHGHDA